MKKIISKLKILLQIIILFFFISSCKINQTIIIQDDLLHTTTIENGDLIFVSAENDNLSEAINRVTQTSQNINFDHVGLIEKTKYKTFVLPLPAPANINKAPCVVLAASCCSALSFSKIFSIPLFPNAYFYAIIHKHTQNNYYLQ